MELLGLLEPSEFGRFNRFANPQQFITKSHSSGLRLTIDRMRYTHAASENGVCGVCRTSSRSPRGKHCNSCFLLNMNKFNSNLILSPRVKSVKDGQWNGDVRNDCNKIRIN